MNECPEHWAALKLAITSRGLGDFMAADGKALFKAVVAQIDSKIVTLDEFDPLFTASGQIFSYAIQNAGLGVLAADEKTGKPRCPLCFVAGDHAAGWIEGAADNVARMVCRLRKGPVHFGDDGKPLDIDEPLPEAPARGD